jgi:hypothetical protein
MTRNAPAGSVFSGPRGEQVRAEADKNTQSAKRLAPDADAQVLSANQFENPIDSEGKNARLAFTLLVGGRTPAFCAVNASDETRILPLCASEPTTMVGAGRQFILSTRSHAKWH